MKKIFIVILKGFVYIISYILAVFMISLGIWEICNAGNIILFIGGVFAVPYGIYINAKNILDTINLWDV